MKRQPGTSKTCHRTERVLRQILMLLRLQRIKARMATTTSNRASSVQHRRLPRPQPHPPNLANLVPVLPDPNRQRTSSSCTSSGYLQFPGIPLPFLNALLQRSNRASVVIPQLRAAVATIRDSKRSLRFSHRHRHSQQMQRQLERQAGSEQPNRPPRVRLVNVIIVPNPHAPSTDGGSSRSSSSSSRSGHRRRRTHSRSSRSSSSRMGVIPGRPHVLNLLRRMMVPMVENRHGGNQNPNNGRGMFVQEQQARTERTPEKGNSKGGGDVDDKTM